MRELGRHAPDESVPPQDTSVGRLGVFTMSTEREVIKAIIATERTERLASRLGEDRIQSVFDAIKKSPTAATSARRLARSLGLSRLHVEASLSVLYERRQIQFRQGCAVMRK